MMATLNKHTEVAEILLEAGADVNLQSNNVSTYLCYRKYMHLHHSLQEETRTALMYAAKHGIFTIVKLLLRYKPNVHVKDSVSQIMITVLCVLMLLVTMTP